MWHDGRCGRFSSHIVSGKQDCNRAGVDAAAYESQIRLVVTSNHKVIWAVYALLTVSVITSSEFTIPVPRRAERLRLFGRSTMERRKWPILVTARRQHYIATNSNTRDSAVRLRSSTPVQSVFLLSTSTQTS